MNIPVPWMVWVCQLAFKNWSVARLHHPELSQDLVLLNHSQNLGATSGFFVSKTNSGEIQAPQSSNYFQSCFKHMKSFALLAPKPYFNPKKPTNRGKLYMTQTQTSCTIVDPKYFWKYLTWRVFVLESTGHYMPPTQTLCIFFEGKFLKSTRLPFDPINFDSPKWVPFNGPLYYLSQKLK